MRLSGTYACAGLHQAIHDQYNSRQSDYLQYSVSKDADLLKDDIPDWPCHFWEHRGQRFLAKVGCDVCSNHDWGVLVYHWLPCLAYSKP